MRPYLKKKKKKVKSFPINQRGKQVMWKEKNQRNRVHGFEMTLVSSKGWRSAWLSRMDLMQQS
jgi:hypothetical protein